MNRNRVTPTQGRPLFEPLEPRVLLSAGITPDAEQLPATPAMLSALATASVCPDIFEGNDSPEDAFDLGYLTSGPFAITSPTAVDFTDGITWMSLTPPAQQRSGAGGAAIGSRLYVGGGTVGGVGQTTLQSYDISTGSWQVLAPMHEPRTAHGVVTNGTDLFAFGGCSTWDTFHPSLEIYSPQNGTWMYGQPMPQALRYFACALAGDMIYVVGGQRVWDWGPRNSLLRYSISGNSWSYGSNALFSFYQAAAVVYGSKVYVFGGYASNKTQIYDIPSDTWSWGPDLPTGLSFGGAAVLDGKIYFVGGNNNGGLRQVLILNPSTNTWARGADLPVPMEQPIVTAYGGKLYVTDGQVLYEGALMPEPDVGDTLATARDLGTPPTGTPVTVNEQIGNGSYAAKDVDLYKFTLSAAGTVTLDVAAQANGSPLDAYLRLFGQSGTEIRWDDDTDGRDPYISLSLSPGTYYAGVSGYANRYYDPAVAGSGVGGSTGSYELKVSFAANVVPSISLLQPDSDLVLVPGAGLTVQWDDADPDSNASIMLALDPDDTAAPWANDNQTWLARGIAEDPDGPRDQYYWLTTDAPPGTYTIWARIDDGLAVAYARAPGRVTIQPRAEMEVLTAKLDALATAAEQHILLNLHGLSCCFADWVTKVRRTSTNDLLSALKIFKALVDLKDFSVSGVSEGIAEYLTWAKGLFGIVDSGIDIADERLGMDIALLPLVFDKWVTDNKGALLDEQVDAATICDELYDYLLTREIYTHDDVPVTALWLAQHVMDGIAAYKEHLNQACPPDYPFDAVCSYLDRLQQGLYASAEREVMVAYADSDEGHATAGRLQSILLGSPGTCERAMKGLLDRYQETGKTSVALFGGELGAGGVKVALGIGTGLWANVAEFAVFGALEIHNTYVQMTTSEQLQAGFASLSVSAAQEGANIAATCLGAMAYLRSLEWDFGALRIDNTGVEIVRESLTYPSVVGLASDGFAYPTGTITLSNNGASAVSATVKVEFYSAATGGQDPVWIGSVAASLPAGQPTTVTVPSMPLPPASSLGAVSYKVQACVLTGPAISLRFAGPVAREFSFEYVPAHYLPGATSDFQASVGLGGIWALSHYQISPLGREARIEQAYPGSDLDLHLYDSLGRHVGFDNASGSVDLEIPGVRYSGPGVFNEWIEVPQSDEEYTIKVVGFSTEGEEPFLVHVYELPQRDALVVPVPLAIDVGVYTQSSEPFEFVVTARELGGQRDYVGLQASISDLLSDSYSIPASLISVNLPSTKVPAGGGTPITFTVDIPDDAPPGEYRGTVRLDPAGIDVPVTLMLEYGPPVVRTVSLNDATTRGVSGIDPSGRGVRSIEMAFSGRVDLSDSALMIQKVAFPNGVETLGEMVTPLSVTGSGTNRITVALDDSAAVDTWLKVILRSDGVGDRIGRLLDGEMPADGSGRGYLFDPSRDLPTGDGLAGGDAVFYVGSLRGDFSGDLAITAADKDGFAAAWRSGSLDADFRGVGFGPRPPDGRITLADINGFTSVYQAGIALGRHLDPLPLEGGGLASEVTPLPPLTAPSAGTDILTEAAGLLPLSQQTAPPVTGPQDTHLVQGDEEPLDLLRLRRLRPVAAIQSAGAVVLRV